MYSHALIVAVTLFQDTKHDDAVVSRLSSWVDCANGVVYEDEAGRRAIWIEDKLVKSTPNLEWLGTVFLHLLVTWDPSQRRTVLVLTVSWKTVCIIQPISDRAGPSSEICIAERQGNHGGVKNRRQGSLYSWNSLQDSMMLGTDFL